MGLAGKVALVTGGGSGIGRSICLRVARDGADVAVADVDGKRADAVAAEVKETGRRTVSVAVDVSEGADVAAVVERVRRELGPVQILVNSAGIGALVPLAQMTDAQWHRMIAVHLNGTFHCTRAALPDMVAGGWGRVVSIAATAGLNGGGPGLSHYAAAKAGIIGFTKSVAQEVGPFGVTVNAIAPGLIDTPLIRQTGVPEQLMREVSARNPMRRIGAPEDIAAACAYLVAEEASFITGQVISPNGGGWM